MAETVVLLHGILRTGVSMRPLEKALREAGYAVKNLTYSSTRHSVPDLAAWLASSLIGSAGPLGFVTHSMGAIVTRAYLARPDALPADRAVFIAPPNTGSVEADRTSRSWFYKAVLGPAVFDLRTDAPSYPVPSIPFGVIAGGTGKEKGFAARIPGDNDARVRVAETRLEGMRDFLLVPRTHTFIMQAPEVIAATLSFLRSATFGERGV
jgi:triacylglycerol lipase